MFIFKKQLFTRNIYISLFNTIFFLLQHFQFEKIRNADTTGKYFIPCVFIIHFDKTHQCCQQLNLSLTSCPILF